MRDRRELKVVIELPAYAYMRACVEAVPGEITLLGAARYERASRTVRVETFYLPDQVCTAAHTEVSAEALDDVLVRAVRDGMDVSTLRVWMHSHGTMTNVSFSGVDDHNLDTAFPQAQWVVSVLTNRAGELRARVTVYEPVELDFDNVPVTVGLSSDVEESVREEVRRRVRTPGVALAQVGRNGA